MPTFHGLAADLAAVAATLVGAIGRHLQQMPSTASGASHPRLNQSRAAGTLADGPGTHATNVHSRPVSDTIRRGFRLLSLLQDGDDLLLPLLAGVLQWGHPPLVDHCWVSAGF